MEPVKRLPRPKTGVLMGYHFNKSPLSRHRAILAALRRKHETPLSMGRHLSLLGTLTKRTQPKASKVYKANAKFLFSRSAS
jgi:hypothetical protein